MRLILSSTTVLLFVLFVYEVCFPPVSGLETADVKQVAVGGCGGNLVFNDDHYDCKRDAGGATCTGVTRNFNCEHLPVFDTVIQRGCDTVGGPITTACAGFKKWNFEGSGGWADAGIVPCGTFYNSTPCNTTVANLVFKCSHDITYVVPQTDCNPGQPAIPAPSCGDKPTATAGC